MVTAGAMRRALAFIDSTGVAGAIETRLADSHIKAGRPRKLPVRVLLAGLMVTYDAYATAVMTVVYKVLVDALPAGLQWELGLRDRKTGKATITLTQMYYLFDRIASVFEHTAPHTPGMNDVTRVERKEAWQNVIDALTGETGKTRPACTYAIDETAIETAARGKRGNRKAEAEEQAAAAGQPTAIRVADRDARHGYKTATNKAETGTIFGFQAVTFTRANPTGDGAAQPPLLDRIVLVPGDDKGTAATLDTLAALARQGARVTEIVVDRGFSYAKTENWAQPLRDAGIEQVIDMHANDRGRHPHPDGYVMVDGQPYCSSLPDELVTITRPVNLTRRAVTAKMSPTAVAEATSRNTAIDAFDAAIARRELYRFVPFGKTKTGRPRWQCPIHAGKALPGAVADYDAPMPVIVHPTGQLPKACRQKTIVIDDDVDLKLRQRHVWGSDDWKAAYSRRTRAEGSHGLLKGPSTGGIRRGWTRYTGITRTGLLLAIAVAVTNIRTIERWQKDRNETLHPCLAIGTRVTDAEKADPNYKAPNTTAPPGKEPARR